MSWFIISMKFTLHQFRHQSGLWFQRYIITCNCYGIFFLLKNLIRHRYRISCPDVNRMISHTPNVELASYTKQAIVLCFMFAIWPFADLLLYTYKYLLMCKILKQAKLLTKKFWHLSKHITNSIIVLQIWNTIQENITQIFWRRYIRF